MKNIKNIVRKGFTLEFTEFSKFQWAFNSIEFNIIFEKFITLLNRVLLELKEITKIHSIKNRFLWHVYHGR